MAPQILWSYEVRFAPALTAPASARAFVRRHLTHHGLPYLIDDICLVVSELVTNAVVHALTPVRVEIEEMLFCVKLTVSDESADLPVLLPERVADKAEGGRGLGVIDAVCSDWGTDPGQGGGKSVWAQFGVRP